MISTKAAAVIFVLVWVSVGILALGMYVATKVVW